MPKRSEKRTSEILTEIIQNSEDESISLGRFVELLGDRAFALAILVFSLPNSLPIPGIPGFSTITGLPITFIAIQMVMGRQSIWLPKKVAEKEFSMKIMKKMLGKAIPAVVWLERSLRPRWLWVTTPHFERVIGLMFVVLSLIIALPIPGGNFLPGVAMSLIALGMLEKDGMFVSMAMVFSLCAIMIMYKIILLALKGVVKAFHKMVS